jgi:hypothetical protein
VGGKIGKRLSTEGNGREGFTPYGGSDQRGTRVPQNQRAKRTKLGLTAFANFRTEHIPMPYDQSDKRGTRVPQNQRAKRTKPGLTEFATSERGYLVGGKIGKRLLPRGNGREGLYAVRRVRQTTDQESRPGALSVNHSQAERNSRPASRVNC